MACASNELSIALCCNGGPTVACNVLRFLGLCSPRRVFSLCGMHGPSGKSGAGPMPFALTEAQTVSFFNTLVELAPAFFERLVKERLERIDAAKIQALLQERPLQLLDVNPREGCLVRDYLTCQGPAPWTAFDWSSPGLVEGQKPSVADYASAVASRIAEKML